MTEPVIALLDRVWSDIAALCDGLTGTQWELPTDCPEWTIHDTVAHVIGGERTLLSEQSESLRAESWDSPQVRNDFRRYEEWIETSRGWGGNTLLDELRSVAARRLDALRVLTTADWDREGFTPEGTGPYRVYMEVRVFDCWYHDQDIREALDRPGFLDGEVADASIGRIRTNALPYLVGKKAGVPPNTTVAFDIAGAAPISAAIAVPPEGRAVLLEAAPDRPTVRITTDRRTFTRLAGGRWSGEYARAKGALTIEGDEGLGNRIVDNLAFTR